WLGKILKENMVYCQYEGSDSLLSLIFSPMLTTDEICQWQLQVIDMIAPNVDILEKEFAAGFYTAINRIRNLQIKMEPKTYFAFLRQLSLRIKVPFKGEPLHGLQIMGPLETRALDFENVIILSVNEGIYPATSHLESFIPYNLRVGYGLPVQEYLDAVSSYHFYRLIYRAKNVKLIFDSRTGGVQSTESSRFIKQLKYHYHYPIVEKICTYDSSVEKDDAESIEKSREVIERLAAKFAYKQEKRSYLSATTLNTYLTCPAQFYYSKVMGIQEEQEVSEDMEANLFGTIFHETMERIYKPLSGMEVSKHTITPTKIREIVEVVMRKECHLDSEPISGKMLISLNLLCKMVECTIKADNDALPFRHLVSEQPLRMEMELEDRCLERVQLGGTIDRMDLVEGDKLIIADYKTGSAKNVEFSAKNGYEAAVGQLFCMGSKHMNYKIPFQMLFYATLASHNEAYSGYEKRFKVYQLKSIFNENPVVTDCPQEVLEMYGDMLKSLVDEIFNPEVPFEYKPDKNVCCYCPANLICKKSLL
ncbi:MAG: PD-(D/E)XK nuclease family protein, partial [Bacteroidales bacterium]|nr:PD-(D/E)XK nuclease family protein [Bacteroidales bacterium]